MPNCVACETVAATVKGKTVWPARYASPNNEWELDWPHGPYQIPDGPLCREHARIAAPDGEGGTTLELLPELRRFRVKRMP